MNAHLAIGSRHKLAWQLLALAFGKRFQLPPESKVKVFPSQADALGCSLTFMYTHHLDVNSAFQAAIHNMCDKMKLPCCTPSWDTLPTSTSHFRTSTGRSFSSVEFRHRLELGPLLPHTGAHCK